MIKNLNISICLLFVSSLLACNSSNNQEAVISQVSTAPIVENTSPVTPVVACKSLTLEDLKVVYPNRVFKIETDRNDAPNIYEALSACRYAEVNKQAFEIYYVDLEVRAKASPEEARRFIDGNKEMDYDKKGKSMQGFGDDAYYSNVSMVAGGPKLEFIKGNVYYKLNIQTIKSGSFQSLEKDILDLARKVLD